MTSKRKKYEESLGKKAPRIIQTGWSLVLFASILFFIDAIAQVGDAVNVLLKNEVDWSSTMSVLSFLKRPFFFVFFVFGGIVGVSYSKRKDFLAGWVGLVVLFCFFIFAFDIFDAVLSLIKTSDYPRFLGSLLSVQIDTTLYVIGWFMSKDYFED